ncbi:hypothetical protein BDP27DRAFT_1403911 [Rhodocollybia butyracea]|uniref:Uncharacterized protein n=1 Tax=Rhodocollybia butyracea TaxID=206335 RepID=A0A9P5PSL4_9AGAR|nr:hypothetical protein BDP27DRAFT_1403911 [Rhodocollybia butyracea]
MPAIFSNPTADSYPIQVVPNDSNLEINVYDLAASIPEYVWDALRQNPFLVPRLQSLMLAIQKFVPRSRVYSVFAPEPVAELFARLWSDSTGIWHYPEPYYAAQLSFCTQRSFKNRQATTMREGSHYNLRPAIPSDLLAVAKLCLEFSQGSEPFVLDWEGAVREAEMLIYNKQVWVHEIQGASDSSSSESRKVYHKVGFVGLNGSEESIEGVERWSEIGFDRTKVQLGHW